MKDGAAWVHMEDESPPDDWTREAGRFLFEMRDRDGRIFLASRALFNNSGWKEINTNREVRPVHWRWPDGKPPDAP